MGYMFVVGFLSILMGLLFYLIGSRSRGEMEIEIGWFKGPIWFLLIVFGFFLILLGPVFP